MTAERAGSRTSAALEGLTRPTPESAAIGARILSAVRLLIGPVQPEEGSTQAMRLAMAAARRIEPGVPGVIALEVASAAMAAPWLSEEQEARAVWIGLALAGRLVPGSLLDASRDTGTWGAIGGAVGIDTARGLGRGATVANLAASLALEAVTLRTDDLPGYVAIRAGHAASVAILAVMLADAGFVADPEAIGTLDGRLNLGAPLRVPDEGWLADAAIDSLEASIV